MAYRVLQGDRSSDRSYVAVNLQNTAAIHRELKGGVHVGLSSVHPLSTP